MEIRYGAVHNLVIHLGRQKALELKIEVLKGILAWYRLACVIAQAFFLSAPNDTFALQRIACPGDNRSLLFFAVTLEIDDDLIMGLAQFMGAGSIGIQRCV